MSKFLLEDYLKSIGVTYRTSGKNIGEGWIGVQKCPHCLDTRFHFGIHKDTEIYSCWVCKRSGNILSFIMLVEEVSYFQALKIYENFTLFTEKKSASLLEAIEQVRNKPIVPKLEDISKKQPLVLPESIVPLKKALSSFQILNKYLHDRGFDAHDIENWGDTWLCTNGKYSGRIIFPVYLYGELVNYVGRTIVNNPLRYMNCPNTEAILPIKDCLYNYDKLQQGGKVVICEGIFDVLKTQKLMNRAVIGLFGKQLSNNQLLLLSKKNPSVIDLFLDKDAWNLCVEFACKIKMFTNCAVNIIIPNLKDPDSYNSKEEMEQLFK
jgi:DNA primase